MGHCSLTNVDLRIISSTNVNYSTKIRPSLLTIHSNYIEQPNYHPKENAAEILKISTCHEAPISTGHPNE